MEVLAITTGILLAVFVILYRWQIWAVTWWLFRLCFTVTLFGVLGFLATYYAGQ